MSNSNWEPLFVIAWWLSTSMAVSELDQVGEIEAAATLRDGLAGALDHFAERFGPALGEACAQLEHRTEGESCACQSIGSAILGSGGDAFH